MEKKKVLYFFIGLLMALPILLRSAEIGTDDFRLSDVGTDGDVTVSAFNPAVAYNSRDNEFLVVWEGEDTGTDNEYEIYGQLVSATGAEIGSDFRISDAGTDGSSATLATSPSVAYNATDNEYLVVWDADDTGTDNENEIFGQLLDADGGALGTNDFRISAMGTDGSTTYGAFDPDVVHNSTSNRYLVVWQADDNTGSLADNEFEIFGQLLDSDAGAVETDDFRISDVGTDGAALTDGTDAAVAYNATNNEYLVVWTGADTGTNNEFEIFGQLLRSDGVEVDTNDFRISTMGPDANTSYEAVQADVAYDRSNNQYLVVWQGDDDTSPLANDEYEIFGQLLNADGAAVGTDDFRISDMGADGATTSLAHDPAVAYNSVDTEYQVVWDGIDSTTIGHEMYGQRIDADGTELGTNDVQLSNMGSGSSTYGAFSPGIAFASTGNQFLLVWDGDNNTGSLADGEFEIWGQRFGETSCGNGVVDSAGTEACDDGNSTNTDACLNTCVVASCGDGVVRSGTEACDDGNSTNTDACLTTCVAARCGDGIVRTGSEACDDGNSVNTDACLTTCVAATCGDGVVRSGSEACDNGGTNSDSTADACRTTCVADACGDGVIDSDEECDDSNATVGDGCDADCLEEEVTDDGVEDEEGDDEEEEDEEDEDSSGGSGGCSLRK